MKRNIHKGSIINVTVTKPVFEGRGLAFYEGKTIFVNRGLPGDEVEVKIMMKKKSSFYATIQSFKKTSPYRGLSHCDHFPECGGCQYMDVSYPDQLAMKEAMLEDAIQQFFPEVKTVKQAIVPSKQHIYYRNKMEYSVTIDQGRLIAGLKKRHTFDQIIEVPDCQLQSKDTQTIIQSIVHYLSEKQMTPWQTQTRQGQIKQIMIRHSKANDHFMVNLSVSQKESQLEEELALFMINACKKIISFNIILDHQEPGKPTTQTVIYSFGETHIIEQLDKLNCYISPLSFFQTNSEQATILYQTIQKVAQLKSTDRVLDLYCGTGTIGLFLAKQVKKIIGIEENPYAIEDAKNNCIKNEINNAEFRCGRVKNILKFETFDVDCVIVDPPRSGMVPKALRRLCELQCKKIVYVSCHPITLLRDLKEIQTYGYKITTLIPVDMFPNTYHVECVVGLELE
mgnify:CR=1 FL=1